MHKGVIEVVTGSMFSGKTSELIRRLRLCMLAKKKVQVFKSHRDKRYKVRSLVSHDGYEIRSELVRDSGDIERRLKPDTQVVGIDEAQFFDSGLVKICETLADRGLRVIAAGLDLDFRGEPFEVIALLLARSELVTKNLAICSSCGEEAHFSQRLNPSARARVLVGAKNDYEARCRRCYKRP